jgi:hypothetical protein
MSDSHEPVPYVIYDADGRIDMDVPCLRCGYNLRTLFDDRDCPECGASVHESARLLRLCHYKPDWLYRLANATVWIGTSMICFALFVILVLWSPRGVLVKAASDVIFVCVLVGLVGFWRITTPHSRGQIHADHIRIRARWTMVAAFVCMLLKVMCDLRYQPQLATWFDRCSIVCLVVGAWATLTYAVTLAARIPEPRLIKHVRVVGWGFAACFLVLCVNVCIAVAGLNAPAIAMVIGIIVSAALLALIIWTILLLIWYRRRFHAAASLSQQLTDAQFD